MDEHEADERYTRLVDDLGTLYEFLDDPSESRWREWMGNARRQIVAHDGEGLTYLLRAYGGMGSFNDLPMPREMERVKARVYDDASALLLDLER